MGETVSRRGGEPLWRQIERGLAADIAGGVFPAGSQLPKEAVLAARFQVNRHTLRRAVAALQEAGMVRVEQGRGTFVQEEVIDYPVARRTRFSENILRIQRHPEGRLVEAAVEPAEAEVARGLALRRGSLVVRLERLGMADGRPIGITSHYFPHQRFPDLVEHFRATGSITKALAAHGLADYTRKFSRVTAALPEAEDARLLQQPRNQPILLVESVNVDAEGRPIEYAHSRMAAIRVNLLFEP